MISKDSFSKSFSPKNSIVQKNYTKKSKEISLKPIVLTLNIEQLYIIFFMYIQQKQLDVVSTLNSERNIYKKFNLLISWLEQQDDLIWYDYFSIHNQTISTLRNEILRLTGTSEFEYLCQSIGKKMIDVIYSRIISSYQNNNSNTNILSLIYIYQDYTKTFKDFITIDDSAITDIFNELTAIKETPVSIIGSHNINIDSILESNPAEIIISIVNPINSTVSSIIKINNNLNISNKPNKPNK